jgi:hypothetical protein
MIPKKRDFSRLATEADSEGSHALRHSTKQDSDTKQETLLSKGIVM